MCLKWKYFTGIKYNIESNFSPLFLCVCGVCVCNVTTGKFQIKYVVLALFLLASTSLDNFSWG